MEEGTAQKFCGERRLSIALRPTVARPRCSLLRWKQSDDSERAFAPFPNPRCLRFSGNFGGENFLSLSHGPPKRFGAATRLLLTSAPLPRTLLAYANLVRLCNVVFMMYEIHHASHSTISRRIHLEDAPRARASAARHYFRVGSPSHPGRV